MSNAPVVPREPSSLAGLPEPIQHLRGAAEGGESYPICWSSEGSAERTKGPVLEAVQPLLDEAKAAAGPGRPLVLEIASGLGEHVKHLAEANPEVTFQPTECDPHLVGRVSKACAAVHNIAPGLVLNALSPDDWAGVRSHLAGSTVNGVVMQNILHIAPADVTTAIFQQLSPSAETPLLNPTTGWISIYGPFIDEGQFGSEADEAFDEHIRGRSFQLGLRDISRFVVPEAERWGFELAQRLPMPKGNTTLVFRPSLPVR